MNRISVLVFLLIFLYCTGRTGDVAGTISETDSGCAVAGIIHDNEGNVVNEAVVILHDQRSALLAGSAKRRAAQLLQRSDTAVTDRSGRFIFDSVDTGRFLIEVNHHDSSGSIVPVAVEPADTLIERQSTVQLNGMISGSIDTAVTGPAGKIYVVVPELGRAVPVDSSGCFFIVNLPEWEYHLRIVRDGIIATLPDDTVPVPVSSGETTNITGLGSRTGMTIVENFVPFKEITINTDSGVGGGIVFLENDSSLSVRLLVGRKDYYHQVEVKIKNFAVDPAGAAPLNLIPYLTDENAALSAVSSDSVFSRYGILQNISNLYYRVNADTTRFSGKIVLAGIPDRPLNNPVKISGSFSVDIGPRGTSNWDCDFGDTICNCWFIY